MTGFVDFEEFVVASLFSRVLRCQGPCWSVAVDGSDAREIVVGTTDVVVRPT